MINRREAIKRAALMSGIALSSPILIGVLNGCQTDKSLDWQPQFLTLEQVQWVGKIADRILPKTKTLGALDVGVDRFIDLMLKDMYSEKEQTAFRVALDDFKLKNATFQQVSTEEQDNTLHGLEQTYLAALESNADTPKSLFQTIKELTLFGYFTSEAVMTEQLNYHAIPTEYKACIPSDGKLYVDNNG